MRKVENGDLTDFIADNIKPLKRHGKLYFGRNFSLNQSLTHHHAL